MPERKTGPGQSGLPESPARFRGRGRKWRLKSPLPPGEACPGLRSGDWVRGRFRLRKRRAKPGEGPSRREDPLPASPASATGFTHLISACLQRVRRTCCAPLCASFGKINASSFDRLRTGSFVTPDLIRGPTLVLSAHAGGSIPFERLRRAQTIRDGPRIKSGVTIVGRAMQSQCWICVHAVARKRERGRKEQARKGDRRGIMSETTAAYAPTTCRT